VRYDSTEHPEHIHGQGYAYDAVLSAVEVDGERTIHVAYTLSKMTIVRLSEEGAEEVAMVWDGRSETNLTVPAGMDASEALAQLRRWKESGTALTFLLGPRMGVGDGDTWLIFREPDPGEPTQLFQP